jgi:membrane associated rhomboid family serine protease
MLPIREVREVPAAPTSVVPALIAISVVVFVAELLGMTGMSWAFVPRTLQVDPVQGATTIITSMFLHGGFLHLIGNVWFLFVFGPSVESALGARRFAALYTLAGVGAALAQAAIEPLSRVPMLGASGAISGVLAAYVSLFPRRRIDTFVLFFILPIPALFFVLEWFAINLFRGMGALSGGSTGGVAWFAHIGGFLAGLVLVRALFPSIRLPHDPSQRAPLGAQGAPRLLHADRRRECGSAA